VPQGKWRRGDLRELKPANLHLTPFLAYSAPKNKGSGHFPPRKTFHSIFHLEGKTDMVIFCNFGEISALIQQFRGHFSRSTSFFLFFPLSFCYSDKLLRNNKANKRNKRRERILLPAIGRIEICTAIHLDEKYVTSSLSVDQAGGQMEKVSAVRAREEVKPNYESFARQDFKR